MKRKYFLICNRSLLLFMPVAVASGILLECLHGRSLCQVDNAVFTWLHSIVSLIMSMLVVWHICLNWGRVSMWACRFQRHHSNGFRCMAVFFLLAVFTGVWSVPVWMLHGHGGIGGLHGKVGIVCAFPISGHVWKYRKWYAGT